MADSVRLEMYGLYKQATLGDNTSSQPWAVQLEASAKWDAWTANKGISKEDAMQKYVDKIVEISKGRLLHI